MVASAVSVGTSPACERVKSTAPKTSSSFSI
jgi:hypothetical protein